MSKKDRSHEISAIFHSNARKIFGLLLSFLCDHAGISQRELGRRSVSYRDYLIKNGHIQKSYSTGGIQHSAICRAIKGEFPLTYSQVFIWLHLLKEECSLSEQLETDMWRLALYGTPEEVMTAYRSYEHMLITKDRDTEKFAAVRQTGQIPHG